MRGLNSDEVAEPNCFAALATVAAFREGGEWLDALREYLAANKRAAFSAIRDLAPGVHAVPQEATYLLWLLGADRKHGRSARFYPQGNRAVPLRREPLPGQRRTFSAHERCLPAGCAGAWAFPLFGRRTEVPRRRQKNLTKIPGPGSGRFSVRKMKTSIIPKGEQAGKNRKASFWGRMSPVRLGHAYTGH